MLVGRSHTLRRLADAVGRSGPFARASVRAACLALGAGLACVPSPGPHDAVSLAQTEPGHPADPVDGDAASIDRGGEPLRWPVAAIAQLDAFSEADGVLVAKASGEEARLLLPGRWGDVSVRFQFQLRGGATGGLDLRVDEAGRSSHRYVLDGSPRRGSGGIYAPVHDAWAKPLDDNLAARQAYLSQEWNEARIELRGPRMRTWINGVPAAESYSADALTGAMAFVVAGGPEGGRVAWREVTIDHHGERRFEPWFTPDALTGWNRLGDATWVWREGVLGVRPRRPGAAAMISRREFRRFALRVRVTPSGVPAEIVVLARPNGSGGVSGVRVALGAENLGQLEVPPTLLSRRGGSHRRHRRRLDRPGHGAVASRDAREAAAGARGAAAGTDGSIESWPRLDVIATAGRIATYVDAQLVDSSEVVDARGGSVAVSVLGDGAAWSGLAQLELADFEPEFDPEPSWRGALDNAPIQAPSRSLAAIRVAPGFRVELVAAEPTVVDPVALDWDHDGRLWVLEHPRPPAPGRPALVQLRDNDDDGQMDTRQVVAEGLHAPTGFAFVADGVMVLDPPHLWLCPRALASLDCRDRRRLGTVGDPDNPHRDPPMGLTLGLDNWLYVGQWGRRLLYHRGGVRGDDTLTRGRTRLAVDDDGRLYYGGGPGWLTVDLAPAAYAWRGFSASDHRVVGAAEVPLISRDEPVFTVRTNSLVRGAWRDGVLDERGHLRQAPHVQAVTIYRGHTFPAEWRGDAFVAIAPGNVVAHVALTGRGVALAADHRRYPDPETVEREFLASTDERFRPVDVRTGPDGALYVADEYRAIMASVDDRSDYLRDQVSIRGLDEATSDGRIYRVVPVSSAGTASRPPGPSGLAREATSRARPDANPKRRRPRPAETASNLVARLSHPNGVVRDQARQRLVAWPRHRATVLLREAEPADPLARVQRLWALRGRRSLRTELLAAALSDADPRVRVAALHNAEPLLRAGDEPRLRAAVERLRVDPEPSVRLALLATLGEIRRDEGGRDATAAVLAAGCEEAVLRRAAVASLDGAHADMLGRLLSDPRWRQATPGREQLLAELAARAVDGWMDAARDEEQAHAALHMFVDRIDRLDRTGDGSWQRRSVLTGIRRAMERVSARRRPRRHFSGEVASGEAADLIFGDDHGIDHPDATADLSPATSP
ncbi:MAG: DUF1080 domain-containing protein [Myxococcales bacterium FL481]|nr:MAG: DUF1080 domain-containing protein [Myxococcales bacterium FL481]